MRKIIVILLGLVVLGGAGGGGWWFLMGPHAASGAAAAEPEGPPVYVEFNPIQLPVIGDARIDQVIDIVVALEVADEPTAERVIALAPRLNDAYLRSLYGALHARHVLREGIVDVTFIKRRIVAVSAEVMGEGVIRDALVQMVAQRLL
jgi:flagellar basal body-associated protein FliL